MFEGVVRILCDVRHVPDVENNLISLGTFDSNGHPPNTKFYVYYFFKKKIVFFFQFNYYYYIYLSQALINESIFIQADLRVLIESSRVYMSLYCLIIEPNFVFTNSSFDNRFKYKSNLFELISSKFKSRLISFTPLILSRLKQYKKCTTKKKKTDTSKALTHP
jgi:hypothetical protein